MADYPTTSHPSGRFLIVQTTTEAEWLDARRSKVTASEVGKLATCNPTDWEHLREEKAGTRVPFQGNQYTQWGHERETIILNEVKATEDPSLVHNTKLCLMADEPRFGATPDAISVDGRVTCQIKTHEGPMDPARPPRHYVDQVQWELMVTGAQYCIFAVEEHINFNPLPVRCARIYPDKRRQEELRRVACRFLDGGPAVVPGSGDLKAALDGWAVAEQRATAAKATAAEAKKVFLALIEDMEGTRFSSDCFTVTRTPATTRKSVDQKQLREKFPEAWAACLVEKPVGPTVRAPKLITTTSGSKAA